MSVTLAVETGTDEERVLLVPRHEKDYAAIGTVAEVSDRIRLPGGARASVLNGLHRGVAGAAHTMPDGRLFVEVEEQPDPTGGVADGRTRQLEREYRAVVEEILDLRGDDGRVQAFLRSITESGALADTSGYSPDLSYEQRVQLLQTVDVADRLELALTFQKERLAEMQVRKRIREDVESGAEKQQRDYFLRKQMESIRKELGEDDASVLEEYRTKIAEGGMPEAVREQAEKELGRLERVGEQSAESSVIRTYLDWLIAVPWSQRSEERLDPQYAREVLDADHAGLEDVKNRIVEYIAVKKLREERGLRNQSDAPAQSDTPAQTNGDQPAGDATPSPAPRRRNDGGAILTLIGPPGTGKTSIGESIARATGRKFVRMSLGGVRDEAEIRGHRRTYIGALPGRLVRALRDAGTINPVIMLDEVDKVGADWRGDPSSALLEVLDPAQNHSFRDHYLDVELDLSGVLFIATANVADGIPGPLLDRMEVIRFDGYTTSEKVAIARGYLWPRQLERNGLRADEVDVSDDLLRTIVTEYTREAGVRNLEREIGTLLRKTATKIASGEPQAPIAVDLDSVRSALGRQKFFQESAIRTAVPGVATGLAVTGTGGEVLFVEATAMQGSPGLTLTGQLGDVMKESAQIALSYVRGHGDDLPIDHSAFEERTFHVHVPAGAIPKDGPSAGVTMVTAFASLLTGRPVRHTVGMTG
ncbi:MAG TPA: endopeptidase La, partial [Solirubrobacteraceae bacterium]|nr:endopeptidase La [Solirubrobacteraceae bacterium]